MSVQSFWRRISDGVEIHQLWAQFHSEARASYGLYSEEVQWNQQDGESGGRRLWRVIKGLFWAMALKLSAARRVLFVFAILLLIFPGIHFQAGEVQIDMPNLAVFSSMAMLVLLALELADRVAMKRDLEIAREIQSWLMPASAPHVPGLDIAFTTRPANMIAGDYYDAFFRNPEPAGGAPGNLLLVVADVAGKSVPAALLMATLQASLRTLAALPSTLVELTGRLNQYACAQNTGGGRFTTAFLAELEPATGRLTYVNAGHNWPVVKRASGAIERLKAGGLPLGILRSAGYESGQTVLSQGDLLLIFTDGLVEAENEQEQEYGEERMLARVQNLADANADEILRALTQSVDAFAGTAPQHDDITCLVLRTLKAKAAAL
jgi:serine phosphatase RsbU (regulator of sigma subunit)